MRNLVVISLFFGLVFTASTQENKYTRHNKNAPVLSYTTDKCYARSIVIHDSLVFTGNSNGALYRYDLRTKESVNLMKNKKFEEMRDLAFVDGHLIGMQSGSFGLLVRTSPTAFESYISMNNSDWIGTFLDGMDFYGNVGFIMGDPKNDFFSLFYSTDKGATWKACEGKVKAMPGEEGFAASGTNVQVLNDSTLIFVSGGRKSRYFKSTDQGKTWNATSLPYLTSESSGAFSICMISENEGVIVGGDYANPDLNLNTCFYTDDGGKFWLNAEKQPRGYRSCVIEKNGVFYACGTNGIDFSTDKGKSWRPFAHGNFFTMTSDETHLYATIPDGKIQVFDLINP